MIDSVEPGGHGVKESTFYSYYYDITFQTLRCTVTVETRSVKRSPNRYSRVRERSIRGCVTISEGRTDIGDSRPGRRRGLGLSWIT